MPEIRTVTLRGLELGSGMPKIIVPIVAQTRASILEQAETLMDSPFDLVEWRADFYEELFDIPKVLSVLKALRAVLGEKPILVTIRTEEEGGARAVDMDAYTALNTAIAQSGDADLIDVQIFSQAAQQNIEAIHAAGCRVVGSSHDFERTPDKDELVRRMRKAQDLGADISKLAVMPNRTADVITLLDATQEMYEQYADRPIITISMGSGVVSRLCGECFGSAATFGRIGQTSAPGQIPAEQLSTVLSILHQALHPQS